MNFRCLDLTENATVFLTFSFLIRILAGAGDAGFYPSAFTIFAQEFEGNVSTAIVSYICAILNLMINLIMNMYVFRDYLSSYSDWGQFLVQSFSDLLSM